MSGLVLKETGVDPAVRSLARKVADTQRVETEQLQQCLTESGQPLAGEPSGSHHGGGEDGTATVDQVRALNEAAGGAPKNLYLEMLKHHRRAVAAARGEVERGQNPAMVEFARQLMQTREAQLGILQQAAATQPPALPGLTPPSGDATPR